MALESPDVDVLGITVESGDAWQDEEVAHVLRMLELIGRTDVPVYRGATYPLVDKSYTPDPAASLVTDGLGANSTRYLSHFPYLGTPHSGYQCS